MKQLKRLTALLLVLVMMFTLAPMVFAASEFTDVSKSDWFYAPVNWAVNKGITGGIGNNMFGPNNDCTREQVVTFLWADAGKPEPTTAESPFTDVTETDWFFKPVMWAVENGITSGLTATEFGTGKTCTRAQVATFLWAVAGKPAFGTPEKGFLDVAAADWYYNPVMWAVANGITSGIGNGKFGPNNNCTRAQIATFMYAASDDYVKPEPTPAPTPVVTPTPTPTPVAPEDRLEIGGTRMYGTSSNRSRDAWIYRRNNTGKDIAKITFYFNVLYMGKPVADANGNTEFAYSETNIPAVMENLKGKYYYSGGEGRFMDFKNISYNSDMDAYYYWGIPTGTAYEYDYVYVSSSDINHVYYKSEVEGVVSGSVDLPQINRVEVIYADGQTETFNNPKVGPRTSVENDLAYNYDLFNRYGCKAFGHDGKSTCDKDYTCGRCGEVIPAIGHHWTSSSCTRCGILVSKWIQENITITGEISRYDRVNQDGKAYTFRAGPVKLASLGVHKIVQNGDSLKYTIELAVTYAYHKGDGKKTYVNAERVTVDVYGEDGTYLCSECFELEEDSVYSKDEVETEYIKVTVPAYDSYRVSVHSEVIT